MSRMLSALVAALRATVSVNLLADGHTAGEKPKLEATRKEEKAAAKDEQKAEPKKEEKKSEAKPEPKK